MAFRNGGVDKVAFTKSVGKISVIFHKVRTEKEIARESENYSATYYAMLRNNNWEVFIKYGHRTTSHAHPDTMNLEVVALNTVISKDLSNCGYASLLFLEYYKTSVSHNTVVVDGINQNMTNLGECISFNKEDNSLQVLSENPYDGVRFKRELNLTENEFVDVFNVDSSEKHTYDFFFHVEGSLCTKLNFVDADLKYTKNGYQHLSDIKEIVAAEAVSLEWEFSNGMIATQNIKINNMKLFVCTSISNPANIKRKTIIVRAENTASAVFEQTWSLKPKKNTL